MSATSDTMRDYEMFKMLDSLRPTATGLDNLPAWYATRTVFTESCVSTGHQGKAFHRCQLTYQYVVGSTTVVTNTEPCWADATFCYPVSLDVGVNAVDHTVPSNNTGLTLNAYVWSCSTPSFSSPSISSPANSTPATSSVIFQACKFQSC